MSKSMYKYMGPTILSKAFERSGFIGVKCSYPKNYNDPYELFLGVDPSVPPELLAYYQATIGEIPQFPTSCFSNYPNVIPMWSHYAHGHRGFAIEICEEKVKKYLEDVSIDDVSYKDEPDAHIASQLGHAHMTRKPRHTFFLQKAVLSAAYFSKNKSWSYEHERRMIAPPESIETQDESMILYLPTDCVTAVIAGVQTEKKFLENSMKISNEISCNHYKLVIGKSNPVPYFLDTLSKDTYIFENGRISLSMSSCQKCKEPLLQEKIGKIKICSWCAITNSDLRDASINPYNMLEQIGELDDYLRGCEKIWRENE